MNDNNEKKVTEISIEEIDRLQKSSFMYIPNNPSERGMKPDEIRHALYKPFIDNTEGAISLLKLIQRLIRETNDLNDYYITNLNNKVNANDVYTKEEVDTAISNVSLEDGAVTTAKIANSAVNTTKIQDGSITNAKIGDRQITGAKIDERTIINENFDDNSVDSRVLADGSVTEAKLSSDVQNKINDLENKFFTEIESEFDLVRNETLYYYVDASTVGVSGGKIGVINTIEPNIKYKISTSLVAQSPGFPLISYIDSNNVAVGKEIDNPGGTEEISIENYELTIPANASKIFVNWRNGTVPLKLKKATPHFNTLDREIEKIKDKTINFSNIPIQWEYGANIYLDDNNQFSSLLIQSRSRAFISGVEGIIKVSPQEGFGLVLIETFDLVNGTVIIKDYDTNEHVVELKKGASYWLVSKKIDGSDFNGTEDIAHISYAKPLYSSDEIKEVGTINKISILFIGNSLTQDGIAYLPYMLKTYYPDVKFNFYMWYNGGKTLGEQYNYFVNESYCDIFSVAKNTSSWTNTQTTMKSILTVHKFDIVCMQEYFNYKENYSDLTDWNNCRDYIVSNYKGGNSLEFISLFHAPKRDRATDIFNLTKTGNALILQNSIAQDMIPIGIAVYRALSTSLDSLGETGHLSCDGTHTQEGLPCLLQTYVALLWVLDKLGINKSIYGCSMRMTTDIYNTINVPGANIGNGVITGTDEQNILAQEVAIKAYKEGKYFVNKNIFNEQS